MSNVIITPSIIARVALANLENNLVMGNKVYRDYSREYVKVGDTIDIVSTEAILASVEHAK